MLLTFAQTKCSCQEEGYYYCMIILNIIKVKAYIKFIITILSYKQLIIKLISQFLGIFVGLL